MTPKSNKNYEKNAHFLITMLPVIIGILSSWDTLRKIALGSKNGKLTAAGKTVLVIAVIVFLCSWLFYDLSETESKKLQDQTDSLRYREHQFMQNNERNIDSIKRDLRNTFGIIYNREENVYYIADPNIYLKQLQKYNSDPGAAVQTDSLKSTVLPSAQPGASQKADPVNTPTTAPLVKTTTYPAKFSQKLVKVSGSLTEYFGRCIFVNKTGIPLKLYECLVQSKS